MTLVRDGPIGQRDGTSTGADVAGSISTGSKTAPAPDRSARAGDGGLRLPSHDDPDPSGRCENVGRSAISAEAGDIGPAGDCRACRPRLTAQHRGPNQPLHCAQLTYGN